MRLRGERIPRGVSTAIPLLIIGGQGATLRASDGRTYLDFAGGLGALNVGHAHPRVVEAIKRQAEAYTHTSFQVVMYESYIALADRLASVTPGSYPKKTLLVNSGAEAVENAVKIARAYTGRSGIIAFEGAFHGRTLLGLSLTGKTHPYKTGFGPFLPDIFRVPFPYPYRPPVGVSPEGTAAHSIDAIERLLKTTVGADRVAAILVEPVLGEGGFVVPPRGFLAALRELCIYYRMLLITDEIQTGFGRTGRMFAAEHEGVEPDLVVIGKSLAAGLPLAGVVGRAEIMDAPEPGGLGGTYAGNPIACVAALAVLDVFEEEHLVARAQAIGETIHGRFQDMMLRHQVIGDVRGLGAMVAIELVKRREARTPAIEETARVLEGCVGRGLVILKAGLYDNVVRVLVPLVVTDAQLMEGLDILDSVLAGLS